MNDPKTRKKLLWAALLGGGLLISLLFISVMAPSANQGVTNNSPSIRTGVTNESLQQATADQADEAESEPKGFSLGGGEIVSLAWRLLLVVIIIGASVAGLRWWGKRTSGPKSSTGFLRVVDTLAISNGRTIHLVALGDRVIAVGATTQQLTLLNELTEAESLRVFDEAAKPDEAPLGQFAAQLFEQMKRTGGQVRGGRHSEIVIGEPPAR